MYGSEANKRSSEANKLSTGMYGSEANKLSTKANKLSTGMYGSEANKLSSEANKLSTGMYGSEANKLSTVSRHAPAISYAWRMQASALVPHIEPCQPPCVCVYVCVCMGVWEAGEGWSWGALSVREGSSCGALSTVSGVAAHFGLPKEFALPNYLEPCVCRHQSLRCPTTLSLHTLVPQGTIH